MHNRHICVKNGMNRIKAARVPCGHISSRWFVKNVAYFCFLAEVLWLLASIIWKVFRSYVFTQMNRSVLMAYAPITCNAYHSASAPVAARYFLQMHACNARVYVGIDCFPPPPYATYTFLANILRQIIIFTQCWYNHAVGFFNVRNGHQQPYHGCLQPKTHKVVSIFFWIILNKTFFFWGFVQNNLWLSQYYFGSCRVRININESITHYVSLCSCSLCFFCLCNHLKN